jgi:outer membrane protein OmpA-like peptidoglycan-associated protein
MKYSQSILLMLACSAVLQGNTVLAQADVTAPTVRKGLPKTSDYRNWSIGLHGGLTYANTDIATSDFSQRKPGFGARITKSLTHNFALQGNFFTGKIAGENKDLSFTNDLKWEASLNVVLTIGNLTFIDKTNRINLYGFFGYGYLSYGEPQVTWKQRGDSLSTLPAKSIPVIPFGAGIKYHFSDRFVLQGEYSLHTTSEDEIDGRTVNLSENDYYTYINLGLTYILGKQEKAIEWVNPFSTIYADLYDVKDRVDRMTGDTDKDGVADIFDREPNTPEGNKVYGDGTSVDADGDGVPDAADADPFSAKGARVDANGRELDSDGDGVPDSRDLEPNTDKGMLIDARGIGIPGISREGGTAVASGGAANVYIPSVFFEVNSAAVGTSNDKTLAQVALILRQYPDVRLNLIGNTDKTASEPYNEKLGQRRAEAVKSALVKRFGVDASRLTIQSKGESDPLAKYNNDYHINRRVDFLIAAE